ncbi:MAG TPA: hypothetical protein VH475_13890 [Tepidisphaeraceae bacterium]
MTRPAVCLVLAIVATGCGVRPIAAISSRSTVANTQMDQAIARGVAFLQSSQNPDGSWGTGRETRGLEVYSMVPGSHDAFRVATTALCVMALREAGETAAHDKGLQYLIHHGEARRDDGALLYNTWAHIYALQCLAIEMRHNADPRLRTAADWHLDRLARYQTHLGGWNYYDFQAHTQTPSLGPTSFQTAAGLVALDEARRSGIDVPDRMIELCVHRLEEMRTPEGAYLYGSDYRYRPQMPANRARGSVGRTQACNDALWMWKSPSVDQTVVRAGLDLFFREHAWIEMGRKRPYPHESWYQTSGYYYYFGHYHAARLIARLGDSDLETYGPQLAQVILPHQEPDGSWWDYAMWDYHKPYGTAYAVMALLRVRNTSPTLR